MAKQGWLKEILDENRQTVNKWPEWKRNLMKWMEDKTLSNLPSSKAPKL